MWRPLSFRSTPRTAGRGAKKTRETLEPGSLKSCVFSMWKSLTHGAISSGWPGRSAAATCTRPPSGNFPLFLRGRHHSGYSGWQYCTRRSQPLAASSWLVQGGHHWSGVAAPPRPASSGRGARPGLAECSYLIVPPFQLRAR